MHVPDGFIDAPVSGAAGAVAAASVAVCLRGARGELDERTVPLGGLLAAFVFAAHALRFPLAVGTSGHLLGATLAAVLIGPYTAVLCASVVLVVQSVLLGGGGTTTLGVGALVMVVVPTCVGYAVFLIARRLLPRTSAGVGAASFAGALLSLPAAALAFAGIFAVGATSDVPLGTATATVVGLHILLGVAEAAVTVLVVSAVLGVRPDLVRGAADLAPGVATRPEGAAG